MKIDLKAKLIVSLIHLGYLDCFAVRLSSQFSSHTNTIILTAIFQV